MQTEKYENAEEGLKVGAAILTKRLLHSPVYKNVWTFQSKESERKHVIFVGERSVHVKEIVNGGRLRDVTVKDNFGCKILSSRVLGRHSFHLNEDDESVVDDVSTSSPQSLLLCLGNHQVLMLSEFDSVTGQFLSEQSVPLPLHSRLGDPGQYIAVDPRSRAFAVAAIENTIVLHNIGRQRGIAMCSSDQHFRSILTINVEAVICAVDFLFPPEEDDDCIDLVVIGTRRGRLCVIICSWNYFSQMEKDKVQIHSQRLGQEHGMATLLAPLKHAGSFLVACERVIAIYRYGHDGSIQQVYCTALRHDDPTVPVSLRQEPSYLASSRRPPLWTAWSRSSQSIEGILETLYMVREDGWLHYLAFGRIQGNVSIVESGAVGQLAIDVDSAFVAFYSSTNRKEMCVACGDKGDAALYEIDVEPGISALNRYPPSSRKICARMQRTELIQNQAVGTRLATVNLVDSLHSQDDQPGEAAWHRPSDKTPTKVFTTSGSSQESSVSELRYGLRMNVAKEHEFPNVDGVDNIWSLYVAQDILCFICSFPWQSSLVFFSAGSIVEYEIATEPTLAVSILPLSSFDLERKSTNIIIQATLSSIRFLEVEQNEPFDPKMQQTVSISGTRITAASVSVVRKTLVTAIKSADAYLICMKSLSYQNGEFSFLDVAQPFKAEYEPTSLSEMTVGRSSSGGMDMDIDHKDNENASTYHAVGDASGAVNILQFNGLEGWKPVLQICGPSADVFNACVSLIALPSTKATILLCGFRNGTLRVVEMQENSNPCSLRIKTQAVLQFGGLPLKVVINPDKRTAAYVYCESSLYSVEFCDGLISTPSICQVFVEQPDIFESKELHLDAICCIADGWLAGHILCISDGTAYVGSSATNSVTVLPRHISLPGTSKRIMYSSYLGSIAVITTSTQVNWETKRRCQISTLSLIECNTTTAAPNSKGPVQGNYSVLCSFPCMPGETINDLAEWFYTRGAHTYHFLIATTTKQNNGEQASGGLKMLKVTNNRHSQWSIDTIHDRRESDPVYAVNQFGTDGLVYGCGLNLNIRRFNSADRRFDKPISHRLGSPAIHITTTAPLIFVTTAAHGLLIFKVEDNTFSLVVSEDRARSGLCHLQLRDSKSFIVTDKDCNIANIRAPESLLQHSSVPAWLTAKLPCSLTSLVKVDVSPPWKQKAPGNVEVGILGSAADGSLVHISILTEPAWTLLNLLQLLCHCNPDLRDHSHGNGAIISRVRKADLETRNFHVDGAILERLLRKSDAASILKKMLSSEDHGFSDDNDMVLDIVPPVEGLSPGQCEKICRTQLDCLMQTLPPLDANAMETGQVEEEDASSLDKLVTDLLRYLKMILDAPM